MFLVDEAHGVRSRAEAFGVSGVVDQCGFDSLGGSDGEDGGDHAGGHAGEEVAGWGESAGFRVGKSVLDAVEREEADTVFGDGALWG